MIGYMAVLGGPVVDMIDLPQDAQVEPMTYAHSAPALQALATMEPPSALVTVPVSDEWAACCPTCFVAVGGMHTRNCDRGGAVLETEAVFRPREHVRP